MSKVYVNNNSLNGTICAEMFILPNLLEINLKNNDFSGSIPHNISESYLSRSRLRELDLSYNKLSGTIPANFAYLRNLSEFC